MYGYYMIWKPYPPDPRYMVSEHGDVTYKGRKKTPFLHKNYLRVNVNNQPTSVHILVIEAFIGPRPEGMMTCHWDDDKLNNHYTNLRWGTHGDNQRDSVRNKTHKGTKKTHCPLNHELEDPNVIRMGVGRRKCRACHNASNAISRHKREHGVDISDEKESRAHAYYERIMANVE